MTIHLINADRDLTIFLDDPTSRWHGHECLLWVDCSRSPDCQ